SNFVRAAVDRGIDKNVFKKMGDGKYITTGDNKPFDPKDIKQVLALINKDANFAEFRTGEAAFLKLSNDRSEKVKETIVGLARDRGLVLDQNQFRAKGVGILEPTGIDIENRAVDGNRRVEFS